MAKCAVEVEKEDFSHGDFLVKMRGATPAIAHFNRLIFLIPSEWELFFKDF
ncbi:hypothetical protein CCP1ISM_680004 [Azospirillaceae bacterium]